MRATYGGRNRIIHMRLRKNALPLLLDGQHPVLRDEQHLTPLTVKCHGNSTAGCFRALRSGAGDEVHSDRTRTPRIASRSLRSEGNSVLVRASLR